MEKKIWKYSSSRKKKYGNHEFATKNRRSSGPGIPIPLSDCLGPKTPGMAALDQQIDGPFGRPGGDPSTRGRFMRCSMRFNIKPGCLLLVNMYESRFINPCSIHEMFISIKPGCLLLLGGLNVGPPL